MTLDTASPADVGPVPRKDRIAALDLIRGLAILGILAVNADGFAAPLSAYGSTTAWPFPNEGLTALSMWVVQAFFHEKFITLFSMLFGVSLYLVGGELRDAVRGRIAWRRLAWLFVFAMIHGFLIWWGDVLSLYAVVGVVMMVCRSWSPKRLMIVGVILYAILGLLQCLPATVNLAPPEKRAEIMAQMIPGPERIAAHRAEVAREIVEARSSAAGALAVNARAYLHLVQVEAMFASVPTLGLMMIGLSLFKTGFLAGRSPLSRYWRVIVAGLPALAVIAWLAWQKYVTGAIVLGGDGVAFLLTPMVSLAYASGLILLWRAGAGPVMGALSAAGRMAFTNYLTQSIIMTSIFYGGRGALMGQIDRPGLWLIVFAIWALQLIWSPLWLSRFEMGPFEWVWRSLTYGRPVRLRRASVG